MAQLRNHALNDLTCSEQRPEVFDAHAELLGLVLVGERGAEELFRQLLQDEPACVSAVMRSQSMELLACVRHC